MPNFKELQTNAKAESEGTWVPYPDFPSIEVKIGRIGNDGYQKRLGELLAPFRKGLRPGSNPPEAVTQKCAKIAFVEVTLKDWRGIEDDDGNPWPCNEENKREIVENEGYHDFIEWMILASNSGSTFRISADEITAGN